eukprot:COSAG04_NODE_22047_length_362_cov_0.939163_1_plen_120_part_11
MSRGSLLLECAVVTVLVHARFEEELRQRLHRQRSLWRSPRVRRAFLRLRAASGVLSRRALPARPSAPQAVSMVEGEVVARICHAVVALCIILLLNEQLEMVESEGSPFMSMSSDAPAEAM